MKNLQRLTSLTFKCWNAEVDGKHMEQIHYRTHRMEKQPMDLIEFLI